MTPPPDNGDPDVEARYRDLLFLHAQSPEFADVDLTRMPEFEGLSVAECLRNVSDAPGEQIPVSARLAVLYDLAKAGIEPGLRRGRLPAAGQFHPRAETRQHVAPARRPHRGPGAVGRRQRPVQHHPERGVVRPCRGGVHRGGRLHDPPGEGRRRPGDVGLLRVRDRRAVRGRGRLARPSQVEHVGVPPVLPADGPAAVTAGAGQHQPAPGRRPALAGCLPRGSTARAAGQHAAPVQLLAGFRGRGHDLRPGSQPGRRDRRRPGLPARDRSRGDAPGAGAQDRQLHPGLVGPRRRPGLPVLDRLDPRRGAGRHQERADDADPHSARRPESLCRHRGRMGVVRRRGRQALRRSRQ